MTVRMTDKPISPSRWKRAFGATRRRMILAIGVCVPAIATQEIQYAELGR